MPRSKALTRSSEVIETLTLIDLCRISGCSAEWLLELVEEGILEPQDPSRARFDSVSITVIHKVRRLQTDLRLNLPGVALALSLADENARLKRRVQQLESAPPIVIPMPNGEA